MIASKDQNIAQQNILIRDLQNQMKKQPAAGQAGDREAQLASRVSELQKQCQALTDDMKRAEQTSQEKQSAL